MTGSMKGNRFRLSVTPLTSTGSKTFPVVIFIVVSVISQGTCLHMTAVTIPAQIQVGSRTMLSCFFRLQPDESVYTVNWYRDGKEFFRYSPSESPPIQTFNRAGIFVDPLYSNMTSVSLKSVSLSTSGKFRCEIATEAPLYHTIHAQRDMVVVDLPSSGPSISGARGFYSAGDIVRLNCTSARSKPAAALTWYVNNELVDGRYVEDYPIRLFLDGLESSSIGLRLPLTSAHFASSTRIRIKCTAQIAALYWRSHERHVYEHSRPTPAPTSGTLSLCDYRARIPAVLILSLLAMRFP